MHYHATTTTTTMKKTAKSAPATTIKKDRGLMPVTEIPLRVTRIQRGTFDEDLSQKLPIFAVQTDFHSLGKIKNGPEASVCEIMPQETAIDCGGTFEFRLGQDRAERIAEVFAGSTRLLRAANRLSQHAAKMPVRNGYAIEVRKSDLQELRDAIDAIESGEYLPQKWLNRPATSPTK